MACVEAMKTALAQAESFTQSASEMRTLGQAINSVGRNLGGIVAVAERREREKERLWLAASDSKPARSLRHGAAGADFNSFLLCSRWRCNC